jgi:hypothetical protein
VTAFRAVIPVFFILHPLLGTDVTPQGDTPQYDLFPHSHGEFIDEPAGKLVTLMASGNAFCHAAVPDIALLTVHKPVVGQASLTNNILCGQVFTVGQNAFAGYLSPVQIHQPFLEFFVTISVGDENGTDTTVKPAGGCIFRTCHGRPPWKGLDGICLDSI